MVRQRASRRRRGWGAGVKAISIQQPWAWLIANGHKDVENRSWPTKLRGRVLIHAGKKLDVDGYNFVRRTFPDIPLPTRFDVGGIVGEARITDCVRRSDSPWFFGEYGFVMAEAKPLEFVAVRGQLGFFDVDLFAPPAGGAGA